MNRYECLFLIMPFSVQALRVSMEEQRQRQEEEARRAAAASAAETGVPTTTADGNYYICLYALI